MDEPYDCGFFFCRHPDIAQKVFQNSNAAYLSGSGTSATIPSPLNIGIENSRRFRALPVYATLRAYGRTGYREMLQKQIHLARAVAAYLFDHPAFELLPSSSDTNDRTLARIYIIVLFRAKNDDLNKDLVQMINASSKIYVSGTSWEGKPACRIAVSNWQVDVARDSLLVKSTLHSIVEQRPGKHWAAESSTDSMVPVKRPRSRSSSSQTDAGGSKEMER